MNAPRAAENAVVTVQSLSKRFENSGTAVAALNDISFSLCNGHITGIVGPDGAGKTTLMRILAGLLEASSGTVSVFGQEISGPASSDTLAAIQERLGYMPQKFGLYQDLTVQENLDLFADLRGVTAEEKAKRSPELLQMTGLSPFLSRLAGKLSGGMKQKLGLACSLIKSPELLLLDEPTVGVDPVSRRDLWKIVSALVREKRICVAISTTYLDEAERCDRVLLLHEGSALAEGSPADFHERVRGKTFVLRADGIRPRDLQARVLAIPDVVDATIRSGRVRAVVSHSSAEMFEQLRPESAGIDVRPVEPRFEDAFLSLLPAAPHHAARRVSQTAFVADADNGPAVAVENLSKRFGDFVAVDRLSFQVARGEIFGLLGPNGAGKSTTFRMLCGLQKPTDGRLQVAGRDLRRFGARARNRLGYMAQQFSLYGALSVTENLRFFGTIYGLNAGRLRERIDRALDEFGLRQRRDEISSELPAGYKQRLAMAAALLHEPEILFLDEPTSGVDPLARREFWLRINAVARSGVTVVVTTHFMEEAEFCDRLLIIVQGKALAIGTPEEIRHLAVSETLPEPSIEDAFIRLAEQQP
jgi:ABC-2 type transport system ATP-binding protein